MESTSASPDYRQGSQFTGELRAALVAAADYRGDVTLSLTGGVEVLGYVFNVGEHHLDLLPKDDERMTSIPLASVEGLVFSGTDTAGNTHRMRITDVVHLTPSTFELVLNDSIVFTPGQHVILEYRGLRRTYSIVSTTLEPNLRLCVRLVQGGELTPQLSQIQSGEEVVVQGPFGNLLYAPYTPFDYFICTGTGIAPFMSIIREYELQKAALIYGVRQAAEAVYLDELKKQLDQLVVCSTRSPGMYQGRVTDYLASNAHELKTEGRFYLCGNGQMVDDVVELLQQQGVSPSRIVTEHFFE